VNLSAEGESVTEDTHLALARDQNVGPAFRIKILKNPLPPRVLFHVIGNCSAIIVVLVENGPKAVPEILGTRSFSGTA